jgi:hypothetical protein
MKHAGLATMGVLLLAMSSAASSAPRWMEYQLSTSSDDRYRVDTNSLGRVGDLGYVTDDVSYAEPQPLDADRNYTLKGEHLVIGCAHHTVLPVSIYIDGGNLPEAILYREQMRGESPIVPQTYVAKLATLACDPPPLKSKHWVSVERGVQVLTTPSPFSSRDTLRIWMRTGKYSSPGVLPEREFTLERWDLSCAQAPGQDALVHSAHIAVAYNRLLSIQDEDELAIEYSDSPDPETLSLTARALVRLRFCSEGA